MALTRFWDMFRSETEETIAEEDVEGEQNSVNESDTEGTATLERPPGWEPLYGTYEKPVYPITDDRLSDVLEQVRGAADVTDVETHVPPLGTNDEHIELRLYTVEASSGRRTLVIDVYVHNFSTWVPEEKGDYAYPEERMSMNGPYYMHLENNLTELFEVNPFAFNLTAFDENEDLAIFSAEVALLEVSSTHG